MWSPVRAVCFNSDGTFTLVLPSEYRFFRSDPFGLIYSRRTDEGLGSIVATYNGFRYIAFVGTPTSTDFSSKHVRVFDHQTGRVPFENEFSDVVLDVVLGADSIVLGMFGRVELWSFDSREVVFMVEIAGSLACPMSLSPDGKSLLSAALANAGGFGLALNRDIRDQPRSDHIQVGDAMVTFCKFSADGQWFLAGLWRGGLIKIVDVRLRHIANLMFWPRGQNGALVQDAAFSADRCYVAAVAQNGLLKVWDLRHATRTTGGDVGCAAEYKLAAKLVAPRVAWLGPQSVAVASLDGEIYQAELSGNVLAVVGSPVVFFRCGE